MTRVAIDLFGGDAGPGVVAQAIADILIDESSSGLSLSVVGPRELSERILAEHTVEPGQPGIGEPLHAADHVPMSASSHETVRMLRERPDLSSVVGVQALREGRVDAFVSIGHTGASVAASVLGLGRLPGMGRPGLAVELPSAGGPVVLVDCGAAPYATAHDLLRFASAGLAYAQTIGVVQPQVGLLTIGGERGKGDHLRKSADVLLAQTFGAQYCGAVEGHDLVGDCPADVVVVDGFTGNIAVKSMEGALRWSVAAMARAYGDAAPARQVLSTSHFLSGGVLLGVPGAVVVGHGASSPAEIVACIQRARQLHTAGVVDKVASALSPLGTLDPRGEPIEGAP